MKYTSKQNYILGWAKKIKLINILGGCCSECGNDNVFALDFHHHEDNKEVVVAQLISVGRRFAEILMEVSKCILLCANCHTKKHSTINSRNSKFKKSFLEAMGVTKCHKCGAEDENCFIFEFHHYKGVKSFNISDFFCRKINVSSKKLIDEISKCQILCRNCHRLESVNLEQFKTFENDIQEKINNHNGYKVIDKQAILDMYFIKGYGVMKIAKELKYAKSTVSTIIKNNKNKLIET